MNNIKKCKERCYFEVRDSGQVIRLFGQVGFASADPQKMMTETALEVRMLSLILLQIPPHSQPHFPCPGQHRDEHITKPLTCTLTLSPDATLCASYAPLLTKFSFKSR